MDRGEEIPLMGGPISGVSIVLTSYNYSRFISRALASASAQSGDNIEIVVVDNASTDDSWSIIESWAAKDSRIRAFRNDENIGMIGNHVRGLSLASKERVLFLSADDYLLPGHVARLLAAHAQHPEIDYFFSTYVHVDEHDRFLRYLGHIGHLRGSYFSGRNEFAGLLTYDCYMCTPTTLWKREEMSAQGGFDPNIVCGDLEAYLRLAGSGARFGFIDTVGVAVRIHAAEVTGKERYVATGQQLTDQLYLLERYLAPRYEHLLHGHEHRIARLLSAKIHNLSEYPIAPEVIAREQHRIDAIVARLSELQSGTVSALPATQPLISVIVSKGPDVDGLARIRSMLEHQSYSRWELVLGAQGLYDVSPLFEDRLPNAGRAITYRTPPSTAVLLNDTVQLANGDIVTYVDASVEWPADHLQRIVNALSDTRINAVTVPVDLVVTRNDRDVARYQNFYGGVAAESLARIGEAVPLPSLAYRRRILDATGPFTESIAHLVDFELIQRILSQGPLGIVDSNPITMRLAYDVLHPCLGDPNAYMATLRAVYNGRPADQQTTQAREQHFKRLSDQLYAMAGSPDTTRAHLMWSLARGAAPKNSPARARKRVLVIDDCVPYTELGRGYPRARTIIENLRDSGYDVFLYPLVRPFDDANLSYGIPGITILYGQGPELLGLTLDAMIGGLDLLWVSRPHNMRDVQAILRAIPRSAPPIVYDAEAVYVERDRLKALLDGKTVDEEFHAQAVARELSYTDECAVVTAVSAAERTLIATRFKGPIEVLSFSIDAAPTAARFEERDGLLFVGAIEQGSPNDDALYWLATNVMPLLPGVPLRHAGVMSSERLRRTNVAFLEVVPDLNPVYNASRIFLAPTRFAAGLPQKAYEAAANGVPIIASPLIAKQLGWTVGEDFLVAETPTEWADAITRLNGDPELWERLREAALARVRSEVSPEAFRAKVLRAAELAVNGASQNVHA